MNKVNFKVYEILVNNEHTLNICLDILEESQCLLDVKSYYDIDRNIIYQYSSKIVLHEDLNLRQVLLAFRLTDSYARSKCAPKTFGQCLVKCTSIVKDWSNYYAQVH